MKTSLFTTIGLALIGAIVAFVITNVVVPDLEPYSFDVIDKAQDSSASSNGYDYSAYTEPNEEDRRGPCRTMPTNRR